MRTGDGSAGSKIPGNSWCRGFLNTLCKRSPKDRCRQKVWNR
jgi:hypothetical protein